MKFSLINNYKIKERVYLDDTNKTDIRNVVRESYGKIADGKVNDEGCCGVKEISNKIGYSDEEILKVPEGANMGLGCGNPQLFSEIKEGEIVIDLGSGG